MILTTRYHKSALGSLAVSPLAIVVVMIAAGVAPAEWTVTPRTTSFVLDTGPVGGIRELSGVTYLGPTGDGFERFAAIQDENGRIITMDLKFSPEGSIVSAAAVSALTLSVNADYEGIAFTDPARNTVFVSEESTPGVHEHSLDNGARLQSAMLPQLFQNSRSNRALESLTRSPDGKVLWTANEEALTLDGPASSATIDTIVRLQQLLDNGASVTAGVQFAYRVDPYHSPIGNRSGLTDLIELPDGTLLALERSFALADPPFRSQIYQVDFSGATDVSSVEYSTGLAEKSFTPVSKQLLWSGSVGTVTDGNLEGLALGPRLANGHWAMVGVLDNAGNGGNQIVSFELASTTCTNTGDYNCNGGIDTDDYDLWRETFGSTTMFAADGNGDGVVDSADYIVWRNRYLTEPEAGDELLVAVPEPNTLLILILVTLCDRVLCGRFPTAS